jgi:hypothetical protein
VSTKPVAHCGRAAVNGCRDLRDGHTRIDKRRELVFGQPTAGLVPGTIRHLESMLATPVADGGLVASVEGSDLCQRQAGRQPPFQLISIHTERLRRERSHVAR